MNALHALFNNVRTHIGPSTFSSSLFSSSSSFSTFLLRCCCCCCVSDIVSECEQWNCGRNASVLELRLCVRICKHFRLFVMCTQQKKVSQKEWKASVSIHNNNYIKAVCWLCALLFVEGIYWLPHLSNAIECAALVKNIEQNIDDMKLIICVWVCERVYEDDLCKASTGYLLIYTLTADCNWSIGSAWFHTMS